MAWTRDFLRRFRVAASPGAASAVGVPADRVAETAAELEPVFARLADAQTAAERIRAEAAAEAQQVLRRAEAEATALVAAARRDAEAERAAAALDASRRQDEARSRALAAADLEAAEVRRHAAAAMPEHVDLVVGRVRLLLAGSDQNAAAGP